MARSWVCNKGLQARPSRMPEAQGRVHLSGLGQVGRLFIGPDVQSSYDDGLALQLEDYAFVSFELFFFGRRLRSVEE